MARNLYILAATLLLFSLVSCGMMAFQGQYQQWLPGNGSLWKTVSLFLLLGGLLIALLAVFTAMFEQVDRRNEQRRRHQRERRK